MEGKKEFSRLKCPKCGRRNIRFRVTITEAPCLCLLCGATGTEEQFTEKPASDQPVQ